MSVTYIGPYTRRKPHIHQLPTHSLKPCCLCSKLTAWYQQAADKQIHYCFDDLPVVRSILSKPNPLAALQSLGADIE